MSLMHAAKILSPCSGVCTIAGDGMPLAGHCQGCARTLDEIGRWRDLDDDARAGIMATLPGRLRGAGLAVPQTLMEMTAP